MEDGPVRFDLYVWAAPRDLDAEVASHVVRGWEAAGGDPAQSPFKPSTDIGWFHRELMKDLPWLEVTTDAVPNPSRLPIVLAADDEPPARVIAIRLPRDDAAAAHEAYEEVYWLAVKYDTVLYEPGRDAYHEPQRDVAMAASEAFWPRMAIRTVIAIVIGVVIAVVAWQIGIPLLSGAVALFALFMVWIFVLTLVAAAREALERRGSPGDSSG
jgi:hypothetical protein